MMGKIIKIIVINATIVVLLLALIDPFFKGNTRIVSRSVNLRELTPNTDIYYTPSDSYIDRTENLVQKPYRIRTDNNGFIIGENNPSENMDSADIIFFGGSTTECRFVDESMRFPYLVGENLININTGIKANVLNGGVSGNHSFNSTINLLAKGIRLNPKVVIFMHNINDLSLLSKTGDYWTNPETRTIIQTQILQDADWKGRIKSFVKSGKNLLIPNIYTRIDYLIGAGNILNDNENSDIDEWRGFRDHNITDYEIIEKKYEQMVLSFIYLSRLYGIEVVLMTQFNRLNPDDDFIREAYNSNVSDLSNNNKIDYDTFCNYNKNLNQKLREIAKNENLLLIDLEKKIHSNSLYIYDPVHLNNNGSGLAADIISKELQDYYHNFKIK